jgi:hypothetical protein
MRTIAISSLLLATVLSVTSAQAQTPAYNAPQVQLINNNPKMTPDAANAQYDKAYEVCIADKTVVDDASYFKCVNAQLAKDKLIAEKAN